MMRLSSSAVLARSLHAHAGDRLVEHQQLRVLDQQHADLQPLLLAVAEQGGAHVEAVLQEDHFRDFMDAVAHGGVAREGQRAEHGASARKRNLEILEHGQIVVDRRGLELAPHPGLDDLVLLQLRQLRAAKRDRARRGLGLSADQVEHRGLAGAVGADDDADLVLLDIEREIVHRLEPVKGHREPFDREQERFGLMTDQHDVLLTLPARRRRRSCRSSRRRTSACARQSTGRSAAARNPPRCRRGRWGKRAPRR